MLLPNSKASTSIHCRTCYEIACEEAWISDNYNQKLDRTYTCRNTEESLVVRITDTCPCTYPANAFSNKRWCCMDAPHFDIGIWSFEKVSTRMMRQLNSCALIIYS